MQKIGRNKPCPCGSGKKYKKCCGKEEKVIRFPSGDRSIMQMMEVRSLFINYLKNREEEVNEEIRKAGALFNIHENHCYSWQNFFFEWFAFDYPYRDNKSLFEIFIQEYQKGLREKVLEFLEKWPESFLSVYVEEEHLENGRVILRDYFTGEIKEAKDRMFENAIGPGEVYVSRLVPFDNYYKCFQGITIIPAAISGVLLNSIHRVKEELERQGRNYDGWKGFLKAEGVLIVKITTDLLELYFEDRRMELNKDNLYNEMVLRRFLQQPQKSLEGKSPLEACFIPKMKGKLKAFLRRVKGGEYDQELVYTPLSIHYHLIEDLFEGTVGECIDFIKHHFEEKSYQEEAMLLLDNIKGHVFPQDMREILVMWYEYSSTMSPQINKRGTWAAALEYHLYLAKGYENNYTQKGIAAKYGVSSGTIYRNTQFFEEFFYDFDDEDLQQPELVFSTPGMGDKRAAEGILANVGKLLNEQNFESIEEANAFLQQIMEKGLPEDLPIKRSKEYEAQELIYEAWDSKQIRQKMKLAKKALEIDPNNADAYVLLAEHEGKTVEEKIELYKKGIEAGEKALGKEFFSKRENIGHFWGMTETRPYMRAKMGLALQLLEKGEREEAIGHFEEMLKLNPNDNQGVRYILVPLLLEEQRMKRVREIFSNYPDENSTHWIYFKALYFFIQEGIGIKANEWLQKAISKNSFVPQYLQGLIPLPIQLPEYTRSGSKEEAMVHAHFSKRAWEKNKGALEWLRQWERVFK